MGNKAVTTHLEYKDEKSSKFWEISVNGNGLTVRYGKIGTEGQVQTKEFADAATAEKQAQKLIAEKTGKGYQEGAGGKESLSNPAPTLDVQTKTEKPAKVAKNKPLTPADIAKNPESTAEVLASLAGSSEAIDRLLAKHQKAGAVLLEKLSHSCDKATRKAVCLNSNTSKETLVRLAPQFPGDFFQNPAFDWLLIEDPNLLFDIGGGVLKNILKRSECPVSFLKWAASHGDEGQQLAAAMNSHTPVDSLRELLGSKHASVVAAVRGHAALAGEQAATEIDPEAAFLAGIAEALANLNFEESTDLREKKYLSTNQVFALPQQTQLEWSGYYQVLRIAFDIAFENAREAWILRSPENRTLSLLGALARGTHSLSQYRSELYDDYEIGEKLANLNCSASLLEMLAKDKSEWVMRAVASHPNCPVHVLERLLENAEITVLADVASNLNCPEALRQSLMEKLVREEDDSVRYGVAANPSCPVMLLETLVHDASDFVRAEAVANPSCPLSMMENSAKEEDDSVRYGVAANPSCPAPLLEALSQDGDSKVRKAVATNLNSPVPVLEKLAHDGDSDVRSAVASNLKCPIPVLESLAHDEHWLVRFNVVSHSHGHVSLLETLAKDEDSCIREGVGSLPSCATSLLEILAKDEDSSVRNAVASNLSCPETLLEALAQDENSEVRCAVASNLSCPVSVLKGLAGDEDHEVRNAIASNPNCPTSVLKVLVKDKDVRIAVACNPGCPKDLRESVLKPIAWHRNRSVSIEAAGKYDDLVNAFLEKNEVCQSWIENRIWFDFQLHCGDTEQDEILWPTKALLEKGVNHKLGVVRALALAQPYCSSELLAKNQKHLSWLVRAAIARNRNSPEVVLKSLEKDSHQVVAALAKRALSQVSAFKNSANASKGKS